MDVLFFINSFFISCCVVKVLFFMSWKPKLFHAQTFNEFFVRELKPGARPIDCIDRNDVAVCGADSRLMAFKSAEDSTRFWIKVQHINAFILY